MKSIAAFCFVCGVLVLAGSGTIGGEERKGPRLQVKEERHDFGTVVEGTTAVHLFELQNAGDEPLDIEKLQSS